MKHTGKVWIEHTQAIFHNISIKKITVWDFCNATEQLSSMIFLFRKFKKNHLKKTETLPTRGKISLGLKCPLKCMMCSFI